MNHTTGGTISAMRQGYLKDWLILTIEHGSTVPDSSIAVPIEDAARWHIGQAIVLHASTVLSAEAMREQIALERTDR